jgi:coenzyme F420-reducing hydrogenase beta subunit
MGLASIAEKITRKRWTAAEIADIAGDVRRACVTHAADAGVRERAASGGSVTALLLDALERGEADAALVCVTSVEDGRVRARYRLATTAEEVLAAQGSTYVLGDLLGEGLPLLESHPGRVAVVGLPCEITALSKRPHLAEKVALTIALFCGHASRPELVDAVVERMAAQAAEGATLTAFRFRSGHWRGLMRAEFDDGTVVEQPFSRFGLYQNLYVACAKKCLFCSDHFGYHADVSAGDLWSAKYKSDPVKHTAVLARTERGLACVSAAEAGGGLTTSDVAVTEVLDGQRRVAPFHHNVTARAQAGAKLGVKVPDRGQRVRWHERMAASMVMRTCAASATREGVERELAKPRRLQQLKLLWLKGLESLS